MVGNIYIVSRSTFVFNGDVAFYGAGVGGYLLTGAATMTLFVPPVVLHGLQASPRVLKTFYCNFDKYLQNQSPVLCRFWIFIFFFFLIIFLRYNWKRQTSIWRVMRCVCVRACIDTQIQTFSNVFFSSFFLLFLNDFRFENIVRFAVLFITTSKHAHL